MKKPDQLQKNHYIWMQRGLTSIVALQVVVIIWQLHNGSFASSRLPSSQPIDLGEWRSLMRHDPQIGASLFFDGLKDVNDKEIIGETLNRLTGVLFLSDCTECAVEDYLGRWDMIQKTHPESRLYVVSNVNNAETMRSFTKSHKLNVCFIGHGSERFIKECNPFFLPRIYLFDHKGKLTYIQTPSMPTQAALSFARERFDSAKRISKVKK